MYQHALPKIAGVARLFWESKIPIFQRFPNRRGEEIFLPLHPENRCYALKGGRQFLLKTVLDNKPHCFFFGQDESTVFLNQLELGAVQALEEMGESGLDDFLKPACIIELEKLLGRRGKRQGDIHALRIGDSIGELKSTGGRLGIIMKEGTHREVSNYGIARSRHFLTGEIWEVRLLMFPGVFFFVSGVIEAPDHAPMFLEGVHLIGETKGRIRPSKLD